jgi:transcriptional regulator with XRE-family HTH domain
LIDKLDLGSRIRRARKERDLTLKDLEARSSVSATHLSEIERGLTSPTLQVLSRIAAALGRTTSFFLEERWLELVARTQAGSRPADLRLGDGTVVTLLTEGIAGHRLSACLLRLSAGAKHGVSDSPHAGDEAVHVLSGSVRLELGGQEIGLEAGDSAVFRCSQPHAIRNGSAAVPAEMVWVCDHRPAANATTRLPPRAG